MRCLPHDAPFGVRFAGRQVVEMHDPATGEMVEVANDRDLPSWVRDAAHRMLRQVDGVRVADEWVVSLFPGLRQTAPIRRSYSMKGLTLLLDKWRTGVKADLPLWSPASWPGDAETCRSADVEEVSCLVLDYDGDVELDRALDKWGRWALFAHTTASHTPERHKFRVILPLARPVPASEWERVYRWATKGQACDQSTKDPGRRYYLYGGPAGTERRFLAKLQRPLLYIDLDTLPMLARPPVIPRPPAPAVTLPQGEAEREFADRCKHDAGTRERAGIELGGRVAGGYVRDVRCPSCGRASVWWPIVPSATPQALCSHRNSCDWSGWIDTILARI